MEIVKEKRLRITFLFLLIFCTAVWKIQAEEEIIQVGFYELNGFHEYDANGNIIGYDVDYLNKIAEKTGWSYRFVETEDWEAALKLLREGKIDILAPAEKTPERESEFFFSDFSIGSEYGALMTRADNHNLVYEEFESFNHIKVGYVENVVFFNDFLQYTQKNNFIPHLIPYSNMKELLAALEQEEVDAIFANLFVKTNSIKVLGKFGASPFYYMTNRSDPEFLNELNEAIRDIKVENPEFEVELLRKYYPDFNQVPYTREELEYIRQIGTLKVACMSNHIPLSFVDEETGKIEGITKEILNLVSKNSGLIFEYVPIPKGEVSYDFFRENDIALISSVEYNSTNSQATGLKLSIPYLKAKKVFVCRTDLTFDKKKKFKLAVATGSKTMPSVINEKYPEFDIQIYDSVEKCFKAVLKGEVDALLENQYVAEHYLMKPIYTKMSIVPAEGLEDKQCISPVIYKAPGIEDELLSDERLLSILNKAIHRISDDDIAKIVITQTANRYYQYALSDILYLYRYTILIGIFTVFVILTFYSYSVILKKRSMLKIIDSELKLRNITNNINGGVVVLQADENLKITYMNEGFLELIQYSKEEYRDIQRSGYMACVHPNDTRILKELILKQSKCKQISVKLRLRKKNGKYVPTLFNGTITENAIGEKELYCVIMDITEQERLFEALALEQEKHNMVIENSGDIIFEVDCKKRTIVLNHMFEQKFGREIPFLIPEKKVIEILEEWQIHEKDCRIFAEIFNRQTYKNRKGEYTIRIRKADGDYLWCHLMFHPMYDAKGELICIVGKIVDIDAEMKEKRALEEKSRLDGLTGLLNKESFYRETQAYLIRHPEWNSAIIFLDIDNFKMVNDTLGHLKGDEAIKETARKIQQIFSDGALLARFGGDEFCVFLKDTTYSALVEHLNTLVERMRVVYYDETDEIHCSASIGAAMTEELGHNMDLLLNSADKALYYSKEHGKNQFALYTKEMDKSE